MPVFRRLCFLLALSVTVHPAASAATFHVAPTGDDAAAGTAAAPFRTVQRGAEAAQPGDTVLVAPGIYRERVAPPRGGAEGKPILFRSKELHRAVIKGSDLWKPAWKQEGGRVWSGEVDPKLFTDASQVDGPNPFEIGFASTPYGREGKPEYERHLKKERAGNPKADPDLVYSLGQVFVDGQILRQAPFRKEMEQEPGRWWYDRTGRRLFVHFAADGPEGREVEITTRRRIFAPHERGLGHIEIEGFVFEHCGNQYPTDFWIKEKPQNQQAGAVGTRSGHHWKIRRNLIRLAAGVGLDIGKEGSEEKDLEIGDRRRAGTPGHHVVEENWILDNGAAGTAGYFPTRVELRRNVVIGNNALGFTGQKRWESAGIKLHGPKHSLIEGNFTAWNNGAPGIWCDQGPGSETRLLRNTSIGNSKGIDFEIGGKDNALVAANVLIDNDVGISLREAGHVSLLHNLVLGSKKAAVECAVEKSRPGNWSAENVACHDSLISAPGLLISVTRPDSMRSAGRRFDRNLYGADPAEAKWAFAAPKPAPEAFAAWRELLAKFNDGSDADGASTAAGGIEHFFDPVSMDLVLRIPEKAAIPACPADTRLPTDFFGKPFASGTATSPPGPFAGLKPGGNRFRLWSGPLPELPSVATAPDHEPTNDAEVQAQNRYLDTMSNADYAKWLAFVGKQEPERQEWLKTLERQLGSFYGPPYMKDLMNGSPKITAENDAWGYVKDDPALPRMLIIGDSISRSYTAPARLALAGRANVHRAPANCGRTDYFFKHGEDWLRQNGSNRWDLITVNYGIHDYDKKPEQFADNLRRIIARLRETGARILWVRTTPWGRADDELSIDRSPKTNETSDAVAKAEGLEIVDLHALLIDERGRLQAADRTHWKDEAATILGKAVATAIEPHLVRQGGRAPDRDR
jgi:lysophospholipase L1-like esterase